MRPIKDLQQATYFKRVDKQELMESIDLYKSNYMIYNENYEDDASDKPRHEEEKNEELAQSYPEHADVS